MPIESVVEFIDIQLLHIIDDNLNSLDLLEYWFLLHLLIP